MKSENVRNFNQNVMFFSAITAHKKCAKFETIYWTRTEQQVDTNYSTWLIFKSAIRNQLKRIYSHIIQQILRITEWTLPKFLRDPQL